MTIILCISIIIILGYLVNVDGAGVFLVMVKGEFNNIMKANYNYL